MDFPTFYDSEQKIWRGPRTTQIFDAECSVGRAALFMMRSKPTEAPMQISDTERTTLTYGQASAYAVRVAQHLKRLAVTQDDIVGLVAPNTTLLMPVAVGCWLNGTAFHAVNPVHEEHVIKHLFDISKPKLIFCDGAHYEKIKQATAALNAKIYTLCNHIVDVPRVEELLEPTMEEHFYRPEPLKYGKEQTMAVYCSSGTTGLPKGVCMSNEFLTLDYSFTNGATVLFAFSGIDWTSGLFNLLFNVLCGGTRIITTRPYTPEYLLEIIVRYKVSFLATSPTQMSLVSLLPNFTKDNLKSIQLIFQTGSYCAPAILERIRSVLTMGYLMNVYGGTEYGGIAINLKDEKLKSVGKVLPNVAVRILDEESGAPCGPNAVGEVCRHSGPKWAGYLGNEAATREIMDDEGWIRTGDLGYMDDDHYLYLVDRSKDILKYEGMHYSPTEIEQTIAELPDVVDVCVFGVAHEVHGDLAAAAVVVRAGSQLTVADVVAYVNQKHEVKHKKLHHGAYFVDAIARNSNGKTLRRKMSQLCLGQKN